MINWDKIHKSYFPHEYLVLKARDAVDILVIGNYERLCPNLKKNNLHILQMLDIIILNTMSLFHFILKKQSPTLVLQTLQWKQVSCHCRHLYSTFLVPLTNGWSAEHYKVR